MLYYPFNPRCLTIFNRFRASVPNRLGKREAHSSERRQTALAVATDYSEFKDA